MSLRLGKKWNRFLNLTKFEDRLNPDAGFGFVNVVAPPAGLPAGLYFEVDGDNSAQNIDDMVSIVNANGTINITIATSSSDDLTPLNYSLSVSGGEIALAQQAFGTGLGSFKGMHVVTNDGNDTVGAFGLPWATWLEGGAGNDNLTGGSLADRIDAGSGDNVVSAGAGKDTVIAGNGNDNIDGGTGNDSITDSGGNNTIGGGLGDDTITAGSGAANNNNNVTGGAGNDVITTGTGNDTVDAGAGNDVVNAGDGNNSVTAGTGNDTVTTGTGNDTVDLGDGNDSLTDAGGNNGVTGGIGNDTITTGAGNDTIDSGDGNDVVNAGDGNNSVTGGNGDDNITTGTGNDTVDAGAGNDTVAAGAGTDVVTGGAGADNLDGGAGNNDIVNGDTDDVFLSGGTGTGDKLNLTVGSQPTLAPVIDHQNDGFEGYNLAPLANVVFAFSTADIANIGTINEPNYAGGNPALMNAGGLGAGDTISFQNAAAGMTIDLNALPFGLGGGSGITSVIGTAFDDMMYGKAGTSDKIDGGLGNDVITGADGNDTLLGGGGNDVLMGGDGNDSLVGGPGTDSLFGGNGDDFLVLAWAPPSPFLDPNEVFLGQAGIDTLVFQGVPDGDPATPGIQPSLANLTIIANYVTTAVGNGKSDYGMTPGDSPAFVYIP